jgi:hypothetical protein
MLAASSLTTGGLQKVKRFVISLVLAVFACAATTAGAQDTAGYTFQTVNYPNSTFTQLLGINSRNTIAGYHGANINKGFTLILPSSFINENFPGSRQTQVIGINNSNPPKTCGFYITPGGVNHGFLQHQNGTFTTVDLPGTPFNQLLGLNNMNQAAGYYADSRNIDHAYTYDEAGGVFRVLVIPAAAEGSQATGINNLGQISGFYIDSVGKNHGFLLIPGKLIILNFPGGTFTQALGLNNNGLVVGVYLDRSSASHGFIYNTQNNSYQSIDDPDGIGTTVINGINDKGWIVGFYVDSSGNTDGLVGTPSAE